MSGYSSDEDDEGMTSSTATVCQTTRKRKGAAVAPDDLVQRLMTVLDPRFESIERRLDGLLPRAEHDAAVHDLKNRIQTQSLDIAGFKRWRETLPLKMVSDDRFVALTDQLREMKRQPEATRANIGTIVGVAAVVLALGSCILGPSMAQ
ncbi:MAG TPA: hypothetical protein VGP82_02800 [Ktedonobacterales bacterium]|jgi:hypothetical protein|nr:hypothetical protein [Ktedonobacterales bacterium]